MNNFKVYLQARGFSKSTVENYYQKLLVFINWLDEQGMEIDHVEPRDLTAYLQWIKNKQVKQVSAQKILGILKHYFNWQILLKNREDNPARNIKLQGVRRQTLHKILTHIELEALYAEYLPVKQKVASNRGQFTTNNTIHSRNKAILGLLIYQGITTEELQKLTVKNLKLREGKIGIPRGRRSNERTLELKAGQVMDLMEYTLKAREELLALTKKDTDRLFITHGSGQNTLHNALSYLMRTLKTINPKVHSLKQIRASVITHWLGKHNLREVQYMAGHRYVSSTENYLVNKLEDLQDDINTYHPIG